MYEIIAFPKGVGGFWARDTDTGVAVKRKWPQHKILRIWSSQEAAQRAVDKLNKDKPQT